MEFREAYERLTEIEEEMVDLRLELAEKRKELVERSRALNKVKNERRAVKNQLEELIKVSISFLFLKITGRFAGEKKRKTADYEAVVRRYEEEDRKFTEAKEELDAVHKEMADLEKSHQELHDHMLKDFPESKAYYTGLQDKEESLLYIKKEIEESIQAVETVIRIARDTDTLLLGPRGWEAFTTSLRGDQNDYYRRLEEAQDNMVEVDKASERMKKELEDVDLAVRESLSKLGESEHLFDKAFQSIFTDWAALSRIGTDVDMLEDYIEEMVEASLKLRKKLHEVERELRKNR